MRYILVDEISVTDMKKIRTFLREKAIESPMEGLFWAEIPKALLSETQSLHKDCQPFRFALETGKDWIKGELYLRSSNNLKCECGGYCNSGQKDFITDFIESMIGELGIST